MPAFAWRRRRSRTRRDDRGSMPLALLVTLVGVSLSATLSGMVIGQLRTSARAADRAAALVNAQAGLDFALNELRSAVDTTGAGIIDSLPCDWSLAKAGSSGAGGTKRVPDSSRYSVSVGYFLNDPTGLAAVLGNRDPNFANLGGTLTGLTDQLTTVVNGAIKCVGNKVKITPLFGLLKATGVAGPNNATKRTLYATYVFHQTDDYISGGPIVIAGTNAQYCVGDNNPGGVPVEDDPVVAMPCSTAAAQTQFIYPKNLTLALAYSRTSSAKASGTSYPYGLCITATPPADNTAAVFKPCAKSGADLAAQQFSYDVNQQTYYGATLDGTGATVGSGYCLNVNGTVSTGSPLVLKNGGNCGSAGVTGRAFVPDAKVGAGAAGLISGQYVNNGEEGRCLDLTNEDPSGASLSNAGKPVALISYPCKQAFRPSDVFWNHKWYGPLTLDKITAGATSATGQVYTIKPGSPAQNWCMQSPGPGGGWVWVTACDASDQASLQWTVNGETGSTATSYQVIDGNGLCLTSAAGLGSQYLYSSSGTLAISFVITAPCSNSRYQKWNAPVDLPAGPLKGIQEK
jgi:hypothetical protein